uniref:DUF3677 domain-containing protein n=1 Tax=Anopheles atroparvus TaxID=41427 RepID=A0AAG5DFZ9_ANOAO
MDRGKSGPGMRATKKQQLSHPQAELYALGSKSSVGGSRGDDGKSRIVVGSVAGVGSERKREASGSMALGSCAMECESVDLAATVLGAIEQQDSDSVVGYICGAIKLLVSPKSKSESVLSLSLLYLARLRPHLFCNETITSALIAVLKRDGSGNAFKGRNNPTMHILACNLLARGYSDKKQWPESFIRTYIDDAINDRVWVDYEECAPFTDNIVAAFGTKVPPKWMLQPELSTLNPTSRDSATLPDDEHSTDSGLFGDALGKDPDANPPRFGHMREQLERMVMDAVKDQLNRRQGPECSTKNFLRFLSLACGILEVRAFVVPRLEMWIHNGKLVKPVQELLTYLCYNVTGQNAKEHEVLSNLAKVRLKSKPLINIFMIGLKEMINCQPDILTPLLKYVVQNELSNARNPNNMGMLAMMFQTKPTESAAHLAEIYQEFLLQREDVLRTLRFFLRELVKMLRYDINLPVFCKALLQNPRAELAPQIAGSEFRDRIFNSIVDLVCLCMFLSVSPQIREANVSIRSGRETKSSSALSAFYQQQSMVQDQALAWMKDVVPRVYKPIGAADYKAALHKLLLLDSPEAYAKGDQWPPEPERAPLLRMVSEIPLQEHLMLCILLIGIEKEIPFSIQDTMEITEQLVRRAGSLRHIDYPPLEITDLKIIELLFKMSEYHHPDNIVLPANYEPPNLAISSLYWKTWIILLLISAHNPSSFGSFCWEQYPMLRLLMEMCITNQIGPPKPTDEELAVAALEKTQILEFENHLASNPITEQNSLLLSQLILMDPRGVARRPPNPVLDQIQQLNVSHRLGHLLCRSRKPDLLLEIIQRQGTSQAMPWLADLVQNSEGDFNHLPVQCLCEFLLANSGTVIVEASREAELLLYLQRVLQDETGEHQAMIGEILEYFLRRLSSFSSASRQSAIRGLKLLLKANNGDWLLRYLPMIPHFPYVRPNVIVQLRAACQVENIPELVMVYIQFVAAHTAMDGEEAMLEHVMDMSHLIVERTTVFANIIPTVGDQSEQRIQTLNCLFVMFNNFLIKLRDAKCIPHAFTEYPDLLLVQFADDSQCHIHLNIIQAFVILLTHSSFISVAGQILDYWFPEGAPPPQAFTVDGSEPVPILPDWLKLKMIRSSVERLVDAALQGLTPDQIVLFVQNFGTPVGSMSKLLALLDRAVIVQYEAVNAAILNKSYLAQLIEIQQARGAKNGHISVEALELSGSSASDLRRSMSSDTKPPSGSKTKEIEEAVELVLSCQLKQNRHAMGKYRKLIQRLLNGASKSQEYAANRTIAYLGRLMKSPHGQGLLKGLVQNSQIVCFFRALLETPVENVASTMLKGRGGAIKVEPRTVDLDGDMEEDVPIVLGAGALEGDKCGLLVDWVADADSELIRINKEQQMELLFSKSLSDSRPYLLSLLSHQASWATLHQTVDLLMGSFNASYDPSSVLDFIDTLTRNPRLWQGRDKAVPKHEQVEYIVTLTEGQSCTFIDYILAEDAVVEGSGRGLVRRLSQRVKLLLQCLPGKFGHLAGMVAYIEGRHRGAPSARKFLQQLYLNLPPMKFLLPSVGPAIYEADVHGVPGGSLADKFTYFIITTITALNNPRDFQTMSAEMELIVRKLAASHPTLLLRQLSVLASLMQGRAHMDLHVLRSEYHFHLFHQVMGILELLAPLVFRDCYREGLQNGLDCFFQLLRHHGTFKESYTLIFRFVEFLQAYIGANPGSAIAFVEQYGDVLTDLSHQHFDLHSLQQLVQGLSMLRPGATGVTKKSTNDIQLAELDLLAKESSRDDGDDGGRQEVTERSSLSSSSAVANAAVGLMLAPAFRHDTLPPHWSELVGVLRSRDIDEIAIPLMELDALTVKRPALLEDIFDDVIRFVQHPSPPIRQMAHNLVARCLKQSPGCGATNGTALIAFVQCLNHDDIAVAHSALDKSTEYTLCLQEHAPQILTAVFELGIGSRINTFNALRRCIQALKKQHAC